MTYAGQLLKRLILFVLFAILLYCLGKGAGRTAIFSLFFEPGIICRGLWAKYSAHTWEQNPMLDSGCSDIYTSPGCGLPVEMQTCRNGLIVIPCFCNIILGSTDSFFSPSSTVNTVSVVSYTIQWHQRKQSYMCQLGRNCPLTTNLWQVHFSAIFTLSSEVSTGWGDTMDLPGWERCSV